MSKWHVSNHARAHHCVVGRHPFETCSSLEGPVGSRERVVAPRVGTIYIYIYTQYICIISYIYIYILCIYTICTYTICIYTMCVYIYIYIYICMQVYVSPFGRPGQRRARLSGGRRGEKCLGSRSEGTR